MSSIPSLLRDEVVAYVRPLVAVTADPDPLQQLQSFLGIVGWHSPIVEDLDVLIDALTAVVDAVEGFLDVPVPEELVDLVAYLPEVVAVVDAVGAIVDAVEGFNVTGTVDPGAPAAFAEDLVHTLTVLWLGRVPGLAETLMLFGVVEDIDVDRLAIGALLERTAEQQTRVRFERIPELLQDPLGAIRDVVLPNGWATADDVVATNLLMFSLLHPVLGGFGIEWRLPADLVDRDADIRDLGRRSSLRWSAAHPDGLSVALGSEVELLSAANSTPDGSAGPGVVLEPFGEVSKSFAVGRWGVGVGLALGADLDSGDPPPTIAVTGDGVELAGQGNVAINLAVARDLGFVVGSPTTGITFGSIAAGFFVDIDSDVDIGVTAMLNDSVVSLRSIDLSAAVDGFLPFDVAVPFDIGFEWSRVGGFRLLGSAEVVITLADRIEIGSFLTLLDLSLSISFEDELTIGISTGAILDLGPVAVAVDGLGLDTQLSLSESGGLIGPLDLGVGFALPTAVGLGIDAGPVSGGGYLEIDHEAGKYVGIASVEVLSVGITAIVIIETKRPDVDGWSMFFALFIELPQIQLGFGFSLNGVGGLAGINRTIDSEALGSAVRSGSLGSILFPEDPIADAPIIISELEAIFPPANNSYVFGPVVKIGWGTPPIVEAELGIAISFGPDGVIVVVLGSITAILPRPGVELIALRLDFAGGIDTGKGTLWFDASLHDSHIIGFALAGDMALRASFSDSRSFLFSVGGFHPAFTPPAGFPELNRLSIGINAGSIIEISFTAYFAVTSNTVQFGAAFDLWAKIAGFEIAGGTSFDALIQFSPFELQTNVAMYVSVKAVGINLLAVYLGASLTGPSPWHVIGIAEFRVLGISKEIRVNKTIGTRTPQPAPPAAPDLLELLAAELSLVDNWSVVSTSDAGVVFADRSPVPEGQTPPLLARADSTIEVAQTLVPLGVRLDKYGNTSLGDHNRFEVSASGTLNALGVATDWFAPGHYFDVKPKNRLSQPSFEEFEAGLSFGSDAVEAGPSLTLPTGHDEHRVDPEFVPAAQGGGNHGGVRTLSPRHLEIYSAELSSDRIQAFRIPEPARVDIIASPTFTPRMEFAR